MVDQNNPRNQGVRATGPYAITDNLAAEPGTIVGWAPVRGDSLRFVNFSSPRTGQVISGLCVELEGDDRSVWLNNRNGWRRADGWMRKAFLQKIDNERETGVIDRSMPPDEDAVGQL